MWISSCHASGKTESSPPPLTPPLKGQHTLQGRGKPLEQRPHKSSQSLFKGGFWWCTLLILAVLSMPRFGGDEGPMMWTNGVYNAVIILVVFPLIVCIGAGSSVTGGEILISQQAYWLVARR